MNSEPFQGCSLRVILEGRVFFQSAGKWIYPLFDLEDYLACHPLQISLAEVQDKVVGKAAAMLLVRLGAGAVHGGVMSELAVEVLSRNGVRYSYDQLVERIDCQTEEILLNVDDPQNAWRILRSRANRG